MTTEKKVVFTHAQTKKPIRVVTPQITPPSQYPSAWFATNNCKPIAEYKVAKCTYKELATRIYYNLNSSKTSSVDNVKQFLHLFFSNISCTLTEEWKSFNQVIGAKDATITPWDIVTVKEVEGGVCEGDVKNLNDDDLPWIALILVSGCRLVRAVHQNYVDQLKSRIFVQAKAYGCKLQAFPSASIMEPWVADVDYLKMIAAIDMFFYRFATLKYASFRIGTLSSRFKDCYGLTSVGHISKLLDFEEDSYIADWTFTEKAGKELDQMSKEGEEVGVEYSYFPYQSDMNLVMKSYYSAVKNPHIHFIIHAAGSLLGSTRSKNARIVTEENLMNNIFNAKLIAYVFSHHVSVTKVFLKDDETVEVPNPNKEGGAGEEEEGGLVEVEADAEPVGQGGMEWFRYMKSLDHQWTPKMIEFFERAKRNLTNVREGTVGKFVSEHF